MEIYGDVLSGDNTLILSTDSDLFRFLKGIESGFSSHVTLPRD